MEVRLGYKQTEVGVIPEDWQVKQLGALVSYTNGKAHEQNITDYGRYVVVNSKFISTEGEIRKYSDHCYCPTSVGDVLMVMSDVPNGRAIAKCFWVDKDHTYTVNQRICALHPRQIDGKLLFYKLDRNPFYLAFDDGVKQTNLRKDDVLSCPLGIPKSDDEQCAIAGALGDADVLLGALDKLIIKKRDLKQAAMQQLLTGQTRLHGFSGTWPVVKLGSLVRHHNAGVYKKKELYGKGCNIVGVADLYDIHYVGDQTFAQVPLSDKEREEYSLEKNDLLYAESSLVQEGIARTVYVTQEGAGTAFAWHTRRFRVDEGSLLPNYLYYYLQSPAARAHMIQNSIQTAITGINTTSYFACPVPLPSIPEQNAIAGVLSDMDAELAALEQRLAKTRALKQGMMQELLTGRVRLV